MIQPALASAIFKGTILEKLEKTHWGSHSLREWLGALLAFGITWILLRAVHAVVVARLRATSEKTATQVDDVLFEVVQGTYWFFHTGLALVVAHHVASFGAAWGTVKHLVVMTLLVQLGIWTQRGVVAASRIWAERHEGAHNATMAGGIRFVSSLVIWAFVVVAVLASWGVQISAVIAGLGVGGIAAALAVQGILSDVFAGLSMYFDRPFDIGDSIAVGTMRGTVTKIGVRTSRIRSVDGEQIIIPNGDLVKARVQNFARLQERRVVLAVGLEYGLSVERIELARDIALETLGKESQVRVDRGHFKALGPSSLDFEYVYFVLSPDFGVYMDVQQRVLLELVRRYAAEGLSFAFPTQTIHHVIAQDASGLAREV
ncbi:MAG TPA: mechanosensitive ion channel family protein, partial [Polyangiaceae bacterium]|nr:mechanosensitive ion channel family protein [Polyangiaceae bacterium]